MALGAWPFGARMTLLIAGVVMLGFGITPGIIANRLWFHLRHSPGLIFSSMRVPPPSPTSLKAAILNVTADFNEVVFLVQDFLRSPGIDPNMEVAFRQYLAQRAVRSHPGLENALDWLLAVYKFAFPFIVISLIAKLGSSPASNDKRVEVIVSENGKPEVPNLLRTNSWAVDQVMPSKVATGMFGKLRPQSPHGPGTPQERLPRAKSSTLMSS